MKTKLCLVILSVVLFWFPVEGLAENCLEELTFDSVSKMWFDMLAYYQDHLTEDYSWVDYSGTAKWKGHRGDPEGPIRMLFALGGWFSSPDRAETVYVKGKAIDLKKLYVKTLVDGTNPASKGYWNCPDPYNDNQYHVESPVVPWSLWVAKQRALGWFSEPELKNIENWCRQFKRKTKVTKNWVLFDINLQAGMKALGWRYDQEYLSDRLNKLDTLYAGSGWYTDELGRKIFDDYNYWVFHSNALYWVALDGQSRPEYSKELIQRAKTAVKEMPYFFDSQGGYPEFGRSQLYKYARLAPAVMLYKMGQSPLSAGQLRRLIRMHINYYCNSGAIDIKSGFVSKKIAFESTWRNEESYSNPGSVFWICQTLGALFLLDANDPLFSCPEEKLPVEEDSYLRTYDLNHWIVQGNKQLDCVTLFSGGEGRTENIAYCSKYHKYVYNSVLAPVVSGDGIVPCDNILMIYPEAGPPTYGQLNSNYFKIKEWLGISRQRFIRPELISSQISDGKLYIKNKYQIDDQVIYVKVLIFVLPDFHIRVSYIDIPEGKRYVIHEGGYAAGCHSESEKANSTIISKDYAYVSTPVASIMIAPLLGYDKIYMDDSGYQGLMDAHAKYTYYKLPYLSTTSAITKDGYYGIIVKGQKKFFVPSEVLSKVTKCTVSNEKVRVELSDGRLLEGDFKLIK